MANEPQELEQGLEPAGFSAPPDVLKRLREIAKQEKRTLSNMIRIACDEYIERYDALV